MSTLNGISARLLSVARVYTSAELSKRTGVEGVMLYGSTAYGTATDFSDVDIALICSEPEPRCWIEHRIVDGIKVDVVYVPLSGFKVLAEQPYIPSDIFVPWFVLKSLFLGGPHSILYDPSGYIALAKQNLSKLDWKRHVAAPWCLGWLRDRVIKGAAEVKEAASSHAADLLMRLVSDFNYMLIVLCVEKEPSVIAEKLGLAGYADLIASVSAVAPGPELASALLEAYRELWTHTLTHAYAPICRRLIEMGVQNPDKLELIGDYELFWPGYRLHELGRVIAELDLMLRWSAYELERQSLLSAWNMMWGMHPKTVERRWMAVANALRDISLDVSDIVEGMLADTAFKQLSVSTETAYRRAQDRTVLEPYVHTAVQQAEGLCVLAEAVLMRLASDSA